MQRKQIILASVIGVVAVGVIALLLLRKPGSAPGGGAQADPAHLDPGLEAVNAAHNAPDGKTPCETDYNALRAIDDEFQHAGRSKPWATFPDRDTFLARCAALPEQEQLCLQPKYAAKNHKTCDSINERVPSPLDKIVKLNGDASPKDASPE